MPPSFSGDSSLAIEAEQGHRGATERNDLEMCVEVSSNDESRSRATGHRANLLSFPCYMITTCTLVVHARRGTASTTLLA